VDFNQQEEAMSTTLLKVFVVAMAAAVLACGSEATAEPQLSLPLPSAKGTQVETSAVPGFPALYQSKVIKHCPASTQCVAPFARVPNNRLLRATNINCLGLASGNTQVTFVLVVSLTDPSNYFVVQSGDEFRFSINETILSFFEAGTRPRMVLGADTSAGLDLVCNLTGTLLTP
jgi:hypothetical protein